MRNGGVQAGMLQLIGARGQFMLKELGVMAEVIQLNGATTQFMNSEKRRLG